MFARVSSTRSQKSLNHKTNSSGLFKSPSTQRRFLNLHEYLSKNLMADYGVRIQRGIAADTASAASEAAQLLSREYNTQQFVIKSQVLAGGRGKGTFRENNFRGGVHLAKDPSEVASYAEKMLHNHLVTHQTTAEGIEVKKVLVAECLDIQRETYFAILLDRAAQGPVMIASPRGGVDIETVAKEEPDQIFTEPINVMTGPTKIQLERLAVGLGFNEGQKKEQAMENMRQLYRLFVEKDATQVEVNPFIETPEGEAVCVDAKINFDDNAAPRQKSIFDLRDTAEEDPREVEASKYDLNYIGLDGNIGCMVNGAGLAMATMDIIKMHGGNPANFLDVGGSASVEQVTQAFRILTSDSNVKAILVNIFGGIMKCDVIAQGIVEAAHRTQLSVPLVVRLEGTNVKRGQEILRESGIKVTTASDLDDAATKVTSVLN